MKRPRAESPNRGTNRKDSWGKFPKTCKLEYFDSPGKPATAVHWELFTGNYFLRFMGKDSFMTSGDVAKALIREGVVDKPPSSKGALKKVQGAFNVWMTESGRPLTHISRVLAYTVPDEGEDV